VQGNDSFRSRSRYRPGIVNQICSIIVQPRDIPALSDPERYRGASCWNDTTHHSPPPRFPATTPHYASPSRTSISNRYFPSPDGARVRASVNPANNVLVDRKDKKNACSVIDSLKVPTPWVEVTPTNQMTTTKYFYEQHTSITSGV
jgi:hypothetical protein